MQFKEYNFSKEYTTTTVPVTYNDTVINVLKYLPISDKNDLITISLQKAEQDGIYNNTLLEAYFYLNIVYLYTDIEFSDEDRTDEMELYDILENNGIIDRVIEAIGEDEYGELKDKLITQMNDNMKYQNSAAAVLQRIITDLPKNAQAAKDIMDNFDQNKYQQVVNFATAANGGRNINTNMSAETVNKETVPIKPPATPQDHLKKQTKTTTPSQRKIVSIQKNEG